MVIAFCGCLNVKMHVQNDPKAVKLYPQDDLDLTESQDSFFRQASKDVQLDSSGIVVQHNFLMQARNVGSWNIFSCACCGIDTHATLTHPPQTILINKYLMTDPGQLIKLQQNEKFSPVFKIIIPSSGSAPSSPLVFPEKSLSMDSTMATIQQLMSSFLKKEEEKVEERIQLYTEQQQAALLSLQTRVRQERNFLLQILAQKELQPLGKKIQSLKLTKEATPPTTPTKSGGVFSFQSPTREQPPVLQTSRQNHLPQAPDDDLFEFEPDSTDANFNDPFDSADLDPEGDSSRSEGISIPKSGRKSSSHDSALAKSLPMRVPILTGYRTQEIDIDDNKTPRNPAEMEASIKALARSVHAGSDSFWDLPRPRLNTLH